MNVPLQETCEKCADNNETVEGDLIDLLERERDNNKEQITKIFEGVKINGVVPIPGGDGINSNSKYKIHQNRDDVIEEQIAHLRLIQRELDGTKSIEKSIININKDILDKAINKSAMLFDDDSKLVISKDPREPNDLDKAQIEIRPEKIDDRQRIRHILKQSKYEGKVTAGDKPSPGVIEYAVNELTGKELTTNNLHQIILRQVNARLNDGGTESKTITTQIQESKKCSPEIVKALYSADTRIDPTKSAKENIGKNM